MLLRCLAGFRFFRWSFFFLGALFLFLLLELVADQFENGDFRPIANANSGGDDAGVAARAISKLRCDFAEQLRRDCRASSGTQQPDGATATYPACRV